MAEPTQHSMSLRSRGQSHQRSPHTLPSSSTVKTTPTGREQQENEIPGNRSIKDLISQVCDDHKNCYQKFIANYEGTVLVFLSITSVLLAISTKVIYGDICSPGFCERNNLTQLQALHPQTHDFWIGVHSTLKLGVRGSKPSVLLILHNGKESGANCLALSISRALSCSMGISEKGEFYEVDSSESHKLSTFLESTLEKRDSLGVVVYTHLEKLPSSHARSLHFICDENAKKPAKAIIVLVLKVDDDLSAEEDLFSIASKKLRDLWEADMKAAIEPILGRITNIVVGFSHLPLHSKQQLDCSKWD